MTEHTKGPWAIDMNLLKIYGPSGDNSMIARGATYRRKSVREANARLIAAAPDMLEALKEASDFAAKITDVSGPYPYVNGTGLIADAYKQEKILRAIISKAEGK